MKPKALVAVLLAATAIVAVCGIIYELLIGTLSSYLLGDSVTQFSLTIGLFMSSFGLGSFLSKKVRENLVEAFVSIELGISLVGGSSVFVLLVVYASSDFYQIAAFLIIVIIGTLAGMEIPLMGRLVDRYTPELRITFGNLFGFDYIGSMLGSVAFPLLLLPKIGLIGTAFSMGIFNSAVGLVLAVVYRDAVKKRHLFFITPLILITLFLIGIVNSDPIEYYIEQKLYENPVVYVHQTPYQRIVLTKQGKDFRMFLNGSIQFCSLDEYRYHEVLIHPAMSVLIERGITDNVKVLVLGGGDGLALREILKYDFVSRIDLVDLDKEVVELSKTNSDILKLNRGSLTNSKVNVIIGDAYRYVETTANKYDAVFIDLPDPHNESLSKLYSRKFYFMLKRVIKPHSVLITQSTSPFFARLVFWSIYETIKSAGYFVVPMWSDVPSFGEWGFNMFSPEPINQPSRVYVKNLRYLNDSALKITFLFPEVGDVSHTNVAVNTLIRPVILQYYEKEWEGY